MPIPLLPPDAGAPAPAMPRDPDQHRLLTVVNPASGHAVWHGNAASSADVAQACRAARAAFPGWAAQPLAERITLCQRFARLLTTHAEHLAQTICSDIGKPLWEARTEVAAMVAKIAISIVAQATRAGTSATPHADGVSVVRHRPHGVLAVLGPYNFPGHLPNGHIVPALLAGNTVVFKPSHYAVQTALAITGLWAAAGLPPGVLNLIQGGDDVGAVLVADVRLNGILFTGSQRVGALLHRQFAGQTDKLLALEMGGNNALVVWDTMQRDAAVHHAILSAFLSAGQRCTCARRIIVASTPQGDAFTRRLVCVARHLQVGAGDQMPVPFMGPVVSAAVARHLLDTQETLLAGGAQALLRMRQLVPDTGLLSAGIVDVTQADAVPDEEIFGPLVQLIRVPDFQTALEVANATRFGLAASLLSDDPARWEQFCTHVHCGVVNWNRPTTGAASSAPFGGVGCSGNHHPSALYAADYCAYPVASIESATLAMPVQHVPGLVFPQEDAGFPAPASPQGASLPFASVHRRPAS